MSSLESIPDSAARGSRELADVLVRLAQSATDERAVASGRAIVDIVAGLTDDEDILRGAMLFWPRIAPKPWPGLPPHASRPNCSGWAR